MAVVTLPSISETRLCQVWAALYQRRVFDSKFKPTLLSSSMPACMLVGPMAAGRTARLHNGANATNEASETSTGQQQRIPESLVMVEDMAAEAEAAGNTRIWNKLQQLAADFSKAYDGQWPKKQARPHHTAVQVEGHCKSVASIVRLHDLSHVLHTWSLQHSYTAVAS